MTIISLLREDYPDTQAGEKEWMDNFQRFELATGILVKVRITKGDAWYSDKVGEEFIVPRRTVDFRKTGGGERVPHYQLPVHENQGHYRLIDCDDTEIVTLEKERGVKFNASI